ncbi:MAG: agmatine deiminase family protein [Planctomycetaceae bacterium]
MTSPDLSNYRWPAEWEPHASTWLAWPVNPDTWPGIFDRIPPAFARLVAAIARFEPVDLLCAREVEQARALIDAACAEAESAFPVRFHDIPVNDSWCRDYGPIFLNRNSDADAARLPAQVILNWDYNAWGGKYPPWTSDAVVATKIGSQLNIPVVSPGIILEGGAIEGNGQRVVMTTESCLLNPNRNPGLSREEVEDFLRRYLSVSHIVWLPGEGIIGDDTDGHIDQVARFCSETKVLVASPFDADAPEAADLRANREAISNARNASGQLLEAIELKMPSPKFQQGHRLPACYCNFYIANGGIVVPTFEDPADEIACQVLQQCFPSHKIVGVNAIDLIWGLGAFHCMTQQQPDSNVVPIGKG